MGFASGFNAGYSAVDTARRRKADEEQRQLENKWRQAQEDRAASEFEQRQQQEAQVRGLRMKLSDEVAGVNPNAEGGSQFRGPLPEDFAGQQPQQGLAYDPRNSLKTRMQLAAVQGQDMTPLNAEAKQYRVQDIYKARGKEFDGLDDAGVAAWMDKHTRNTDIPLYGTPEKNGKYTMFVPGRPSVSLSRDELKHLYVAEGLMDEDPEGAIKILHSGTDKLRSLARDLVGVQAQMAQVNNAGAHYAATDQYHNASLGIQRDRAMKENAQLAKLNRGDELGQEAAGYAEGYTRAKGLGKEGAAAAQIYDEQYRNAQVRGAGLGLRLPNLHEKPAMSPVDRARGIAALVNAGMSLPEAQMQIDGVDPNAALIESLQRLNAPSGTPAPKQSGTGDRVMEHMREEGAAYQAAYGRWREALQGGRPLSPEEKAQARKFGLQ